MKTELQETNQKLEEVKKLLQEIYNKEDNTEKTMMDFFKPSMEKIILVIANKMMTSIDSCMEHIIYEVDRQNKIVANLGKFKSELYHKIQIMNIEQILALSQENIDGGNTAIETQVKLYWEAGDRLQAIKFLKEQTGMGLKESKDACEKYAEFNFQYPLKVK